MLELIPLNNPKKRNEFLQSFDPYTQSWVSTSLTSKFDIQKKLITKHVLLEDYSVLRANEFWQKLLFNISPTVNVKSKELFSIETATWLKDKNISWAKSKKAPLTLIGYLDQLIHIVSSQQNIDLFLNWQESNQDSMIKWGHWARLSIEYWKHIRSENEILNSWCAALLVEKEFSQSTWGREIIFDLGTMISPIEVALIKKLSEHINVKVLYPVNQEIALYNEVVSVFKDLGIAFSENENPDIKDYLFNHKEVKVSKFSSQLAEIKNVTSEVRKLINTGVSADEILITASQIEDYWPILNLYLQKEGVLTHKQQVSKLFSCGHVNKWLARLRVETGSLTSADIEASYYSQADNELNYEKFKQLYKNIFKAEDIKRNSKVEKFFNFSIDRNKKVYKKEFFKWSLKFWTSDNFNMLEKIITELDLDVSEAKKFTFKDWVFLLESKTQSIEIKVRPSHSLNGIYCENLKDIGALNKKHVFVLGVSDSLLKDSKSTSISKLESDKINSDIGLYINSSESVKNDLLVYSEVSKLPKSIQISYPEHSFTGEILQPSKIWLINSIEKNKDYKKLHSFGLTRWDSFVELKSIDNDCFKGAKELTENQINIDTSVQGYEKISVDLDYSLSVSQIEGYKRCPYIFSARKLFKLKDLPDVDMDLDRMTGGKFTHALFEELLKKESLNYSDKEIKSVILQIKEAENLYYLEPSIWSSLERKYLELGKNFLKFEKKWRVDFPNTKTLSLEKEFEIYWDLSNNEFTKTKTENSLLFKGIIDRIDKHSKGEQVVVIDYKSSAGQVKNYKSWLENDMYQMGMYSFLIDKGLVFELPHKVVGSFYYVAKTFDRSMGLKIIDSVDDLFDITDVKNSQLTMDDKEDFYSQLKNNFIDIINNIRSGCFDASPKDFKNCGTCKWRKICRAQHLM